MEASCEFLDMDRPRLLREQTAYGGNSLRQGLGQGRLTGTSRDGRGHVGDVELALLAHHDALSRRRLVLGPQPAHEPLGLLGPPLLIQLDQAREVDPG
jgi:hypothetical protein